LPPTYYPIVGTVFGLIIGSFLATLVVRWPQGKSVMTGRSRCDNCDHQLGLSELIPIFSHIFQLGKCKSCGAAIKTDHLMIELAAGLIGGLALFVAPGFEGALGAIFGWILLALAALDANHQWLPDRLTALLAVSGLAASLVIAEPDITNRLIGGAVGFLSLFLIARIYHLLRSREGLGGGDPKLLGAIGCWLGWSALPLVILGAAIIGLAAIAAMRVRGETVTASSTLPLGSFMAITAFPLWLFQTANGGMVLLP